MLADAILKAESAQAQLAIALNAAGDAGCSQAEVDFQVELAGRDDPDRAEALKRLAVLNG